MSLRVNKPLVETPPNMRPIWSVDNFTDQFLQVDGNEVTEENWTALTFACQEELGEIIKLLLAKGADPNIAANDGTYSQDRLPLTLRGSNDHAPNPYHARLDLAGGGGRSPGQGTSPLDRNRIRCALPSYPPSPLPEQYDRHL